jgi:CDP-glycerol glycerophosphotransferase
LYLYLLGLNSPKLDIYYITKDRAVYAELKAHGVQVVMHPSLLSYIKMLQSKLVFVDSDISIATNYLLYYSKKIQLWHGVGFKRLEADHEGEIKSIDSVVLKSLYKRSQFQPTYDLFVSTSQFYTENVFAAVFKYKNYLNAGYPRNDVMFRQASQSDLLGTDVETINKVRDLKNNGYKIILYAPTFRDCGGGPQEDGALDFTELIGFTEEHKLIFVMKLHPSCKTVHGLEGSQNVIQYGSTQDIYPLFSLVDLMVTDYSSIYMDFILQDKPVIFFAYDYKKYLEKDRDIQFEYDWITPGPKCYSQSELQHEIIQCLNGVDAFGEKRREIAQIAFEYHDGNASKRIWNYIKDNYLDN